MPDVDSDKSSTATTVCAICRKPFGFHAGSVLVCGCNNMVKQP